MLPKSPGRFPSPRWGLFAACYRLLPRVKTLGYFPAPLRGHLEAPKARQDSSLGPWPQEFGCVA